jgi:hypothetical protein
MFRDVSYVFHNSLLHCSLEYDWSTICFLSLSHIPNLCKGYSKKEKKGLQVRDCMTNAHYPLTPLGTRASMHHVRTLHHTSDLSVLCMSNIAYGRVLKHTLLKYPTLTLLSAPSRWSNYLQLCK